MCMWVFTYLPLCARVWMPEVNAGGYFFAIIFETGFLAELERVDLSREACQ